MLIEFNNQTIQVCANEETDLLYMSKSLYDYLVKETQEASS
jgi:hypothetical protein